MYAAVSPLGKQGRGIDFSEGLDGLVYIEFGVWTLDLPPRPSGALIFC